MDNLIENLFELEFGWPQEMQNKKILLRQFNIGKLIGINSGLTVFEDGNMYFLKINTQDGIPAWNYFTRLKTEGLKKLKVLISTEFFEIKNKDYQWGNSNNILIWQCELNGQEKRLIVDSGSYTNLPPVFKRIDDIINRYMYKLNDVIE